MTQTWDPGQQGVLELPSGRLIRGRGLLQPFPAGPRPEFGLYLLGRRPAPMAWDSRWVRWRDLRLPADDADTLDALTEAWRRSETERVEVACWGGRGRTGTALACLAVMDGIPPSEAVAFVRARYRRGAVETPWQRKYVARFQRPAAMTGRPRHEAPARCPVTGIRAHNWVFLFAPDRPTVDGRSRPARVAEPMEEYPMTTHVADCSVTNCSFNDHSNCNAAAITVGGAEDHASCATFIDIGVHGGLPKVLADVGACQRSECTHNDHLMCKATEVHVGPGVDNADCLTYAHR